MSQPPSRAAFARRTSNATQYGSPTAAGPPSSVALNVWDRIPGAPQVVVVRIRGEHDLASADEVRRRLAEALAIGITVVDLEDCTFLDSSIVASLIAVRRAQGFLALALPPAASAVERTLTVSGVTVIFSCQRSLSDAIDVAVSSPRVSLA
jgi:anti-anti-sigma factor